MFVFYFDMKKNEPIVLNSVAAHSREGWKEMFDKQDNNDDEMADFLSFQNEFDEKFWEWCVEGVPPAKVAKVAKAASGWIDR